MTDREAFEAMLPDIRKGWAKTGLPDKEMPAFFREFGEWLFLAGIQHEREACAELVSIYMEAAHRNYQHGGAQSLRLIRDVIRSRGETK